jgi:hypothetical protein
VGGCVVGGGTVGVGEEEEAMARELFTSAVVALVLDCCCKRQFITASHKLIINLKEILIASLPLFF